MRQNSRTTNRDKRRPDPNANPTAKPKTQENNPQKLANPIFEYPIIFHNRRHTSLHMLSPIKYETTYNNRTVTPNPPGKPGRFSSRFENFSLGTSVQARFVSGGFGPPSSKKHAGEGRALLTHGEMYCHGRNALVVLFDSGCGSSDDSE